MKHKKKTNLHKEIKSKGLSIGFLEKECRLATNTLYNHVNNSRPIKDTSNLNAVKKVFKKYKINLDV